MSAPCPHPCVRQPACTAYRLRWRAQCPNRRSFVGLDVGRSMDQTHDKIVEPISIARCRELLGNEADGLSDVEVELIRRHAEAMAHVIVEIFLQQRRQE